MLPLWDSADHVAFRSAVHVYRLQVRLPYVYDTTKIQKPCTELARPYKQLDLLNCWQLQEVSLQLISLVVQLSY